MDSPWDFGVYCQLKLHQVAAAAAASAASVACFEALQKETGWDHPICDGNTKHTLHY